MSARRRLVGRERRRTDAKSCRWYQRDSAARTRLHALGGRRRSSSARAAVASCDSPIAVSGTPEVLSGGGQRVPAGTSRPLQARREREARCSSTRSQNLGEPASASRRPLGLLGRSWRSRTQGRSLQIAGLPPRVRSRDSAVGWSSGRCASAAMIRRCTASRSPGRN